ncbi:MAG TPA: hypothetical protein VGU46_08430 [Acidobacteriaceae bacterium]|nr:hypothetical protein [Acidobacteriaceae bacterium]
MKITKRRVNTVSEVTAEMDALAHAASVTDHCYDESAAAHMTEFDALRWRTLCAQRRTLQAREGSVVTGWVIPSLYGTNTQDRPSLLENTVGGLNKLAA